MKYYITDPITNTCVGEYELSPMPGCKAICVSHGLKIYPQYRGNGYASIAHKDRLELAKRLGYAVMIATVIHGNLPQEHLLGANSWKRVRTFDNLKTGNSVTLWCKHLTDPYLETSNGVGV